MAYSLADLDAMTIELAQALPFADGDQLLDLIITDGLNQPTEMRSDRVGPYCDYFEEDLVWVPKVKGVKALNRGTTGHFFNDVYRELTPNSPCWAVIGIT